MGRRLVRLAVSPFLRPRPTLRLVSGCPTAFTAFFRIFFLFKIMEPHHTTPHRTPNQSNHIMLIGQLYPSPPVQYVLLAWLLSHRQTLGCFAVLIIFYIHLDFFSPSPTRSRTHTCLPAVVISSYLAYAIFKSFLVQFLSLLYIQGRVPISLLFHLFCSLLLSFLFFSLYF